MSAGERPNLCRECGLPTDAPIHTGGHPTRCHAFAGRGGEKAGVRYSDDRLSLAQEIASGLRQRGFWVPQDWAGPDLITAVFLAIGDRIGPPAPPAPGGKP